MTEIRLQPGDLECDLERFLEADRLTQEELGDVGADDPIHQALMAAARRALVAEAFKSWTHAYLDAHGVPHHPPGPHGAEGCRIGDRMDWLLARLRDAGVELERLRAALRHIQDMAAEDLRKNLVAPCGSIHQIEADARAALRKEG